MIFNHASLSPCIGSFDLFLCLFFFLCFFFKMLATSSGGRLSLHLHFDVNKTVIMDDAASKQPLIFSLQSILAENTKGRVEEGQWRADCNGDLTYADYTRDYCERRDGKKLRGIFVEEGQPGAHLRPHLEKMLGKCERFNYFADSFVSLVKWLRANEAAFDWRMYFRTFGTDLPDVIKHWNALCDELEMPDRKIVDEHHVGRFSRVSRSHSVLKFQNQTLSGMTEILKHFHDESAKRATLALREDYEFWATNGEARDSGKLLLLDPSATNIISVFFDDNAHGKDHKNILDVRSLGSDGQFVCLPDAEARDKFFVYVDPEAAILDDEYYIKKVQSFVKKI